MSMMLRDGLNVRLMFPSPRHLRMSPSCLSISICSSVPEVMPAVARISTLLLRFLVTLSYSPSSLYDEVLSSGMRKSANVIKSVVDADDDEERGTWSEVLSFVLTCASMTMLFVGPDMPIRPEAKAVP